ncbi:splicing factor 3B subunit 2-like protein [Tanacetum coccineum]
MVHNTPTGVETPDVIDLRKQQRKEHEKPLYQVLEEKEQKIAPGTLLGTTYIYVIGGAPQDKPSAKRVRVLLNDKHAHGFLSIDVITGLLKAARKPIVAAIDGPAFGGGLEIALPNMLVVDVGKFVSPKPISHMNHLIFWKNLATISLDLSFPNFTELNYPTSVKLLLLMQKDTKGAVDNTLYLLVIQNNPEREGGLKITNCLCFERSQVTAHYFEEGNAQLDAKHECRDSIMYEYIRLIRHVQ